MRPISLTPSINPYALGSVLVCFGQTKVHVTVCEEKSVPPFLKGTGTGWLTAEYNMLPSATHDRSKRERQGPSGRTQEIQRLIGRSLRSCLDFSLLGERSLIVDCDVLVADGGTRTAAISGGYVALRLGIEKLLSQGVFSASPLVRQIAAISVGISPEGAIIADLDYSADSQCLLDMNLVFDSFGNFIEIQGTAEKGAFSQEQLFKILESGKTSCEKIFQAQNLCFIKG